MSTKLLESRYAPLTDRQDEIRLALGLVENMMAGVTRRDSVIVISGALLSGKTTLIDEIKRHLSDQSCATAKVDFQTMETTETDEETLRRGIAVSIAEQLCTAANFVPGRSIAPDIPANDNAERLVELSNDISDYQDKRPQIIIFDSIEASPRGTFDWAQENILSPLLASDKLREAIIIGSREVPMPMGADYLSSSVKRDLTDKHTVRLAPFTPKQILSQLEAIRADESLFSLIGTESLRNVTAGLPGLIDRAARQLNEIPGLSANELGDHLVEDVLFQHRADGKDSLGDQKEELLAVSLLPSFDEDLLREVLGKSVNPRDVIRKLIKAQVIEPISGRGYGMDGSLRSILSRYVKQNQPRKLIETDQKAAEWFKQEVEGKNFAAIGSRLFHLGRLRKNLKLNSLEAKEEMPSDDEMVKELKAVIVKLQQQSYPTQTAFESIKEVVINELPGVFEPAMIAIFKESLMN